MKPENQKKLFGHKDIFNSLVKLYEKNKLPTKIILSGNEGIGKCTLAYHLINYIYSKDETSIYDLTNNTINENSKSFKLIQNTSHPNFYKIYLNNEKNSIDILQIRDMIKFVQKTSFDNKEKIILIDRVEFLNQNSANSLLKVLEDSNHKILFILIHSEGKKIIKTINSRCIKFKITLDINNVSEVVDNYFNRDIYKFINEDFKRYYFTPKYYIDLINVCDEINFDYKKKNIDFFVKDIIVNKIYLKKNFISVDFKQYLELYIQKKLNYGLNQSINNFSYFNKKYFEIKKFNLDLESFFIEFNRKMLNE